MKTLVAHFDGKVLIPDESVDLPVDQPLKLSVERLADGMAESPADVEEDLWLKAGSTTSAFEFLSEEPDLYLPTDGQPFEDAR